MNHPYNMTIWKPITCACEIELINGKWVSTIHKCNIHKEYTGQKLLDIVTKHNIENSKTEEPGILEFEVRAKFEPEWLKEVKKLASLEKIKESEYNLQSMKIHHPTDREFQYTLSNFLNSSRSILWYLLEEYSAKYNIEIEKYYKDEKYRNKHMQFMSHEAIKFVEWYQSEFGKLKDENYGFLLDQRDFNIHKGYVSQIFELKQGPYKLHEEEIKKGVEIPLDLNNVRPFFPQAVDATVLQLSEDYLTRIKGLVNLAHSLFSVK